MLYRNEYTKEISFPLGGIGSGSIGLAGNGQLVDWEIFNRPAKGSLNGYTHFAVKAKTKSGVITKVLNGDLLKNHSGQYNNGYGHGASSSTMCGFPHFQNWQFEGTFPVAELTFSDSDFPATVRMRAFNPMIPLDEDNSSIPGAFFEIEICNTRNETIEYQTALSLRNPFPVSENRAYHTDSCQMLSFINTGDKPEDTGYGDLTIATDCPDTLTQSYWYRGGWQDSLVTFWNNFNNETDLEERIYAPAPDSKNSSDYGTLVTKTIILPNEHQTIRFILTWNIPNNYNYWNNLPDKKWKNYYAILFKDSKDSAAYALRNWNILKEKTMLFKNILHGSTLDPAVIDAISSTMSVLKTPTVLRLEDGSFYGWEGVNESSGSCEGTCQHVWNYAYALCFLFPKLERSIRENEFKYTVLPSGQSIFRLKLPLEMNPGSFRACVDGQMGMVIKSYREWKISGNDSWLKEHWESIKLVLDYARSEENCDQWDVNGDGVLEGRQHHTLDMELFGPSAWLEGMYLAALKAAAEMAGYLGDTAKCTEYSTLFENGKKWTKDHLFNGKYFIQQVDLKDKSIIGHFHADSYWNEEAGELKYQIGEGCSIDQLLGQWHAHLTGLGEIFDPAQVDTALDSMYDLLYKPSMRTFTNPWRVFSFNDEAGSVICEYPEDVHKPHIPIPYCEETMTGFEYAFAGMLILYGKIEKGLSVIKAIRDRYDGKKRNPYNEIECGSNYARAMASFALLPIFSGFEYDLSKGHIGFQPIVNQEHFRCFFSLGTGWGEFSIDSNEALLQIADGSLSICSFGLKNVTVKKLEIDGKSVAFSYSDGKLIFDRQTILHTLRITL